ncbi:polysaccharide pyruvyl transferase family protein [Rossellomorea marisflavi]|uniref:polysaccharide pyruvyl transferase family protein n=1 Tax=Rossellomorea marisflavi TaxID=189381 RepID=UPI003458FA31
MKIAIVGNYGNDNNGDEAILSGLITQLGKCGIEKKDITVFSNNPINTTERIRVKSIPLLIKNKSKLLNIINTIFHHWKVVGSFDAIIIGGGGLLMDLYTRDLPLYSTIGIFGKLKKKKILIYGVGVGPLRTTLGKFLVRIISNISVAVSVRDQNSKELLNSLGINKEVLVIGDPAFSNDTPIYSKNKNIKTIGVTAVPYFSKNYWPETNKDIYDNYISGMASNIDKLTENYEVTIKFFSTKYPEDVEVTKDIYKKLKNTDRVELVTENMKPTELIKFISELDLVIGTRLHSLILAVLTETPVIGVEYHHKVRDFMNESNLLDQSVPIGELSEYTDLFKRKFESLSLDMRQTEDVSSKLRKYYMDIEKRGITQINKNIMGVDYDKNSSC